MPAATEPTSSAHRINPADTTVPVGRATHDRVIDLRDRARGGHLRSVPTPAAAAAPPHSATAVQFSESVRRVVAVARRHGLRPPVFRSPPRLADVDRSIRRRPNGQVVVAVRRTGRPLAAVRADIIEGVVAANDLTGATADRFRHAAWAGLEPVDREPTPQRGTSSQRSGSAASARSAAAQVA